MYFEIIAYNYCHHNLKRQIFLALDMAWNGIFSVLTFVLHPTHLVEVRVQYMYSLKFYPTLLVSSLSLWLDPHRLNPFRYVYDHNFVMCVFFPILPFWNPALDSLLLIQLEEGFASVVISTSYIFCLSSSRMQHITRTCNDALILAKSVWDDNLMTNIPTYLIV